MFYIKNKDNIKTKRRSDCFLFVTRILSLVNSIRFFTRFIALYLGIFLTFKQCVLARCYSLCPEFDTINYLFWSCVLQEQFERVIK